MYDQTKDAHFLSVCWRLKGFNYKSSAFYLTVGTRLCVWEHFSRPWPRMTQNLIAKELENGTCVSRNPSGWIKWNSGSRVRLGALCSEVLFPRHGKKPVSFVADTLTGEFELSTSGQDVKFSIHCCWSLTRTSMCFFMLFWIRKTEGKPKGWIPKPGV